MIYIPDRTTKKAIQTNRGDILGHLWSTFGIDFQDNPGAIRLPNRMKVNTSGVSNQGLSSSFELFDGRMWTIAGTRIFKNSSQDLITQFTEDASTGAVTTYDIDYNDLIVFNNTLVVSNTNKIYSKASDGTGTGAWTNRSGSLDTSTVHMLAYFKKFDRLYITNGTKIHSSDTAWTIVSSAGDYYLDIGNTIGYITCIACTSDRVWIGIQKNTSSGYGLIKGTSVLEWDGISSQITKEYKIPALGVMSIVVKNDIPYIMDSDGILRAFTGSEFKEVSRLPVGKGFLGFPTNTANSARFIHPKGMCITENNTILSLICNRNVYLTGVTENVNESLPSGIWEYDDDTRSLRHKHPITSMAMSSTSVTDYGQNRLSKVGGLSYARIPSSSASGMSNIICGAEYYSDASSTVDAIFISAPYPSDNSGLPEGQKAGYFVTNFISSSGLKDKWQKVYTKYRQFLASSDKIVLKYRTRKVSPIEISITWVNTTSFTTTTDLSSYVGYEVEVLQGTGSGKCVHISSVTGSGTYTVNLDDTVTGVTTGTAKARIQNWKKAGTLSDQYTESHEFPIEQESERIQLKLYMEFTGDDELYELILTNKPNSTIQ